MKTLNSISIKILLICCIIMQSCSSTEINPDVANQQLTDLASAGDGEKINSGALPSAVTSYISNNYSGQTIIKVEKYTNKYEVKLSSGVKLEFNLDGSFSEVSGGGSKSKNVTLPKVILDYIALNHPGATITKAKKGSSKYDIYLSNGYRLKFNLAGVLKESKYKGK